MIVKTVKISEKGQIAIPRDMRAIAGLERGDELLIIEEKGKIMIEKVHKLSEHTKKEFNELLKHSEKVAEKLWSSKEDDIWDTL